MAVVLWTVLFLAAALTSGYGESLEGPSSSLHSDDSSLIFARTANIDDLDLDLLAEESISEMTSVPADAEPRYRMPFPYAFNGGKPFSLEKDPVTGKIDFEKAPPLKALNYTVQYNKGELNVPENDKDSSYLDEKEKHDATDVEPNEISPHSSLYDFLNLPVYYSSDKYEKDKYPLISSSYANTKVQSGSNSYSISNHRPYHESSSSSPFYVPNRKVYSPKVSTKTSTVKTTTEKVVPTTMTEEMLTMVHTTTAIDKTESTIDAKPTTWKPTSKVSTHHGDNENYTSKERPQMDHRQPSSNDVLAQRPIPTKSPVVTDEYESYEDYEENEYNRQWTMNRSQFDTTSSSSSTPTIVMPETTTSVKSSPNTSAVTTVTSTVMSTTTSAETQQPTVQQTLMNNDKDPLTKYDVTSPQLVTSMPIDSVESMHDPTAHENVIQGHRPDLSNGPVEHVRFPNKGYGRPGIGGALLESTSNIVVPPDQDTVTFVLGNRQNVEDGYYVHGTAVGENPYSGEDFFRPIYGSSGTNQQPPNPDRGTIGLPSISVEPAFSYTPQRWYQSPPMSPPKTTTANEIDSKLKLSTTSEVPILQPQQQQVDRNDEKTEIDGNKSYFVYPNGKNPETQRPVEEHVVIINEADGTVQELTPSTVAPPSKTSGEGSVVPANGLPQLSENLTPPTERPKPMGPKPSGPAQRPPLYYHYRPSGTSRPEFMRPQKVQLPPRIKPGPPEPLGFKRRPLPPDMKLPNILPQFRPNAKVSHGHRGPEIAGTLPAPPAFPNRARPPHLTRRPTFPPSTSAILERLSPPPLPATGIHNVRISTPKDDLPPSDIIVKRFRPPPLNGPVRDDGPGRFPGPKPQKLRLEDEQSERFSIEPPQMPPRPILYPKHRTNDHVPRVATLQMIQQRGGLNGEIVRSNLQFVPENEEETKDKIDAGETDRKKEDTQDLQSVDAPVYVVYPVNTALNIGQDENQDKDESVVVGTRGPHRPLPPDTLQQQESNQNDADDKNTPILMIPNKMYPESSSVMISDFPYRLERPDPSLLTSGVREKPLLVPNEQANEDDDSLHSNENDTEGEKDASVNIIPYLQDFLPFSAKKNQGVISATLQRLPLTPSSTPIAYVYTPTSQTLSHRSDVINSDDDLEYDRGDEKPILLPSQQPSSSSSSAPSPQNFMAPFVASMSAEAPAKNGWSVVVLNSDKEKKGQAEGKRPESALTAEETQTERSEFDPENFKPQLFSGFKPIYEFPTENETNDENLRPRITDMPRSLTVK